MVRRFVLILGVVVLGCLSVFDRAAGQTPQVWNVATGNWNVPANWDGGAVPGLAEAASIENAGTATIDSDVPPVTGVWVGNGATRGNVNMTAGTLRVVSEDFMDPDVLQNGFLVVGRTVGFTGANADSTFNVTGGSIVADQIEVGQSFGGFDSTNARMTIGGNATVQVRNYLRVGHGEGGSNDAVGIFTVKDNATFTHTGTGNKVFADDFIAFGFNGAGGTNGGNVGTLNLQDNAVFSSKRPVRFGWVEEAKGFLNISGNAQLIIDSGEESAAAIMLGDFHNGSAASPVNRPIGVAVQTGGTVTVGTEAARPRWGAIGGSGRGEYTMSGGKLNLWINEGLNIGDTDQNDHPGEGVFTMTGGTVNATELWLGKIGRATGTFTQSGGTVNVGIVTPDGNFVDRQATVGTPPPLGPTDGRLNLGGLLDNDTSTGTYTLSGGTLHVMAANIGSRSTGVFNQSGGTFIADTGVIVARSNNGPGETGGAPSVGTLNLDGGVLQTASLTGGIGASTVNLNGGIIRATGASATFISGLTSASVGAGGVTIDSNGFVITAPQILAGAGGLTKSGAGTLTLTGANTYTGETRVSDGTLSLANAVLANGADVFIAANATLNLTFSGTDTVDSLILGNQVAKVGTWGAQGSGAQFETNRITGAGRLVVGSAFPPGDFDKNGSVNLDDLTKWRGDFGTANSDADGDGDSDGNDFLIWQRNLGLTPIPAVAAAGAVPEPSAGLLALVAGTFLASRRPRGRGKK